MVAAGIIGGCLLTVILIGSIYMIGVYFDHYDKNNPKITFEQFQDWYILAPTTWYFDRCHTVKRDPSGYAHRDISIRFSFIDYWRYRMWLKKLEKRNLHSSNDATTIRLLQMVEHDIDVVRAKTNIEMNQAKNIIEDVRRGIKQI